MIIPSPPRRTCWLAGSGGRNTASGKPRSNSAVLLALEPGLIEAHKELVYILGIQSRRREVDAEFHVLARLTPLSHHDLFTWC